MKKPENLETSHDVLIEKPENFFANFSQSVQKIFSKKVAEISPKLDYIEIFEFLENPKNSQAEKQNFIKNLEKIDLENILPILENDKISEFHIFFIEKLDSIELPTKNVVYKKIPQNEHLVNILKSEKVYFQSKHALFRVKNGNKYPLDVVLSYAEKIPNIWAKIYFVNQFLEEQNWENIEELLPKITNEKDDFIVIESLMQMRWNLEFDTIKKYIINKKIPDQIRRYLAWKCEEKLDKKIVLPFLVENEKNIPIGAMVLMVRKIEKNLTLKEWGDIIKVAKIPLASDIVVALDSNISDREIDEFLKTMSVSADFYKAIFPYREKNYKNIEAYRQILGEKNEDYSASSFIWNASQNTTSNDFIKKHMASIVEKSGSQLGMIFSMKMREKPEKNIYDLYRESAQKFLETFEIIDEKTRSENNKKLVEYQKKSLTLTEMQNAQKNGIDTENFDLTMYMRYGHQIDYPEMAEFIAICVDEYIASGRSRYFSRTRILPRNADKEENVYPFLQSLKTAKYYNKIGIDAPDVMNIFASCMYFSHSANAGKNNIPSIISGSMKPKNGDIHSDFELEARFYNEEKRKNFENISVFEVMREIFWNMQKLENRLDELLENKNP